MRHLVGLPELGVDWNLQTPQGIRDVCQEQLGKPLREPWRTESVHDLPHGYRARHGQWCLLCSSR